MEGLIVLCGLFGALAGAWRAYVDARAAVGPLVRPGEPTRRDVDLQAPPLARSSLRRFAKHVVLSMGWLVLSLYGVFLVVAATELPK